MDIIKAIYLKRKLHAVLFGLAFFIFAARLYDGPLRTYDECYYAGQAKEILVTGDALTMHHAALKNYENDPVYLWSMAAMFKLFGASEFAARFPSAVYGFLTVVAVYLTARHLGGYAFALAASLILATTWEFIRFARYAHLDVCLSFFTAAAIYFFIRREIARAGAGGTGGRRALSYSAASGLCAGLAILSKNILGAFSIAAMACYYIARRDFRALFGGGFLVLSLSAAALPGAWYAYQYAANGAEFFSVHFGYILFKRAVDNPVEAAPAWQYLKVLALTYIPWLAALVPGIYLLARDFFAAPKGPNGGPAAPAQKFRAGGPRASRKHLLFYCVIFVFIYIGVMSLASAKKGWYIMPVYPQFAPIAAYALWHFFARGGAPKKAVRARAVRFVSGGVLFMAFCAFVIGVFPVKLYRNDNLEFKNDIAPFARKLHGAAYNRQYPFQPVGFDCDYFDYQLPLVFYTGIIPRQSVKAEELKKLPDASEAVLFSEREKFPSVLAAAGAADGESHEIMLKTASFVIWKLK